MVEHTMEEIIEVFNYAARNGCKRQKASCFMIGVILKREEGVPVDGLAPNDLSPLQIACLFGHFDIAELLLENDADIDLLTSRGDLLSSLRMQAHSDSCDVSLSLLCLAAGASCSESGNLDLVNLLLEWGADVSQEMAGGRTFLHSIDNFRFNREIMEAILAAGADINALSDTNDTPLHIAARDGDTDCVEFFLQNNARIDALNDDGFTAIDLAQQGITKCKEFMSSLDEEDVEEDAEEFKEILSLYHEVIASIEVEQKRREDIRLEELRQPQCLAFMMGQHERLGEGSMIRRLNPDVARLVLKWV
jgi:hypothetical protein